jgi:16S rRNA (adenine1518-N6/adenine1519-N6)-dimethyltransferase
VTLYATRHDGALRFPCSEIDTVQWFSMEIIEHWLARAPEDFASGFVACWDLFRRSVG